MVANPRHIRSIWEPADESTLMDQNRSLGGFLAKLSVPLQVSDTEESVYIGLHSGEWGLPEGIRDFYRVPLCKYFWTYDCVGHCEEVASECAMQHDVVSVHATCHMYFVH